MSALSSDKAPQPFRSAIAAWMWTMSMLAARREGAGTRYGMGGLRPCDPDDVVRVLDRLYRQRRIDLDHARVLRAYGERQTPPDPTHPMQKNDARLWREAMERLETPLREKGIVA